MKIRMPKDPVVRSIARMAIATIIGSSLFAYFYFAGEKYVVRFGKDDAGILGQAYAGFLMESIIVLFWVFVILVGIFIVVAGSALALVYVAAALHKSYELYEDISYTVSRAIRKAYAATKRAWLSARERKKAKT